MAQNRRPRSVIDTLGEEIVRIISPVSICMFLVVILVSILNSGSSSSITTVATVAYSETSSDSTWDKFLGALLNSLVFVAVITAVTFLMVLLFYLRCTKFLKLYMGFSSFVVLGFMGGEIALFVMEDFSIPVDCITFLLVLYNFAVVGVLAVFLSKMAILVTQGYLVVIGVLVAYWFTLLPEWTTWVLLVAMSLYDLAAVLLPVGPLRILVELAISRDEDIPALVYEARPVNYHDSGPRHGEAQRRLWRDRRGTDSVENPNSDTSVTVAQNLHSSSHTTLDDGVVADSSSNQNVSLSGRGDRNLIIPQQGRVLDGNAEISVPLLHHDINVQQNGQEDALASESLVLDGIGLGASGAIKLGLGDFIFYSVLVGRAAMYDFMTVYACYLAIIAGLGITLVLLALYQKALPALPVSVMLGVLFYILSRFLLEAFVVECSLNLLMF